MTQREALDLLLMGENVYLTGQAGSGKTYLLNQYINFLKENKVAVGVTASTGIAATHLNGMTIHSWSGIGISDHFESDDYYRITNNRNLMSRIVEAKVLIIDEISMLHSYRLDMVNTVCQLVRKNEKPFGGLQVILCGDFFQLPPILEKGQTDTQFAFKSKSWQELEMKICYLQEQHRQLDDGFKRVLNDIRNSDVSESTIEKIMSRLNKPLPKKQKATRLYTHNADVDNINRGELEKLSGDEQVYTMRVAGDLRLVDFLKKNCLAQEYLVLKPGASVMFVKNNPLKGYVNGTLGEVVGFNEEDFPVVVTNSGREVLATPVEWMVEDGEKILAQVEQVPLRLAWAITVHKSQGMSLDSAVIDLSKSFTYGMGYVALSRVRSLEGISLLGINQNAMMVHPEISDMDRTLKAASKELSGILENMSRKEIETIQKQFLKYLLPSGSEGSPAKILKELLKRVEEMEKLPVD